MQTRSGAGPRTAGERAWRIATALSVALSALIPLLNLRKLWPFISEMPVWDQWSSLDVWLAHDLGQPVLPHLLTNYNGHYNLVPRFVFYGLGLLTRWNLHAEAMLCYLAAAALLILLLRMVWEVRPRLLLAAAPISAYLFSLAQFTNFLYGYPFGQWLGQLGATAAIYLLTRPGASRRAFLGAVACALLATFSYASAVAIWPAGLAILFARHRFRPPRVRVGVWLLPGIVAFVLAGVGSRAIGATVSTRMIAPFFLAAIGHPLGIGMRPNLATAQVLGVLLLLAFAALVAIRAFKDPSDPLLPRWGGYGLFAIGSVLLIAIGRSYVGAEQGLASHYVTAASPLLFSLLVLAFESLERVASGSVERRRSVLAAAGALAIVGAALIQTALCAAAIFPILRGWMRASVVHDFRLAEGLATDEEIHQSHHPSAPYVRALLWTMRANRIAWFAVEPSASTMQGSVDRFGDAPLPASKAVTSRGDAWSLTGWAVQTRGDLPISRVDLVLDGAPVAQASLGLERPDVEERFGIPRFRASGWRLEFPAAAVALGEHEVRVVASDRADHKRELGEMTVTVRAR